MTIKKPIKIAIILVIIIIFLYFLAGFITQFIVQKAGLVEQPLDPNKKYTCWFKGASSSATPKECADKDGLIHY